MRVLRSFFRVTGQLLFSPGQFFEKMQLEGGVLRPLAYALAIDWLAAASAFGWKQAIAVPLRRYLPDLRLLIHDAHELGYPEGRESQGEALWSALSQLKSWALHWFWGIGSVWGSPLLTLAGLAWSAFMLWMAALLLLPRSTRPTVTWRGSLRLACFSRAPALWAVLPVVGPAIHHTMALITTLIGLKKVYKINTLRASLVALFPQMLFLGILLVGLGYLGLLAFHAFGPLVFPGTR